MDNLLLGAPSDDGVFQSEELAVGKEEETGLQKVEDGQLLDVQYLTEEEELQFNTLENGIESKFDGSLELLKEAGRDLYTLKGTRFYTKKRRNSDEPAFKNFKDYVKWRFGKSRTTGYNYIILFQIMSLLKDGGFNEVEVGNLSNAILLHEGARDLMKQEALSEEEIESYSRQAVMKFWQVVHQIAPTVNGKLAAPTELVQSVIDVWKDVAETKVLEIDGEAMPLSLKGLLFQDNVLDVIVERVQAKRAIVAEDIQSRKNRRLEELPTVQMLPDNVQQKEDYKVFPLTCPVHGETSPVSAVSAGFNTECGCRGLLEEVIKGEKFQFVWSERGDK